MKDLYLHIGMNKTGTSTLQSLMSENRPLLQNEGILYPETGCRGEAHYGFSMALGLGNRPKRGPKIPDIAELLGKLEEEGQKTQCRKIVISSECFVLSRNPSEIKKAFAEYRVSVIVYLRPHVEWLVSLYNQALKTVSHPPWGGNFEEYLLFHYMRTPYFRYLDFLLLWENAFGRNSMIVRPFQNKQFMDSDLKADFLNQFDARHLKDTLSTKKRRNSESICTA